MYNFPSEVQERLIQWFQNLEPLNGVIERDKLIQRFVDETNLRPSTKLFTETARCHGFTPGRIRINGERCHIFRDGRIKISGIPTHIFHDKRTNHQAQSTKYEARTSKLNPIENPDPSPKHEVPSTMKPDSVDDALTQLTYLVCDINTRETLALFKDHNAAKLYATVFPNAEMMSTIGELDADIATEQSTQHEDQTIMDIHRLRDMLACVQHLVPSTRLVDEIDNVLTETKHYEPS